MKISIIIINFNTPADTSNCLKSLIGLEDELDLELIVIDNSSSDNSVDILKKIFNESIILIENEKNLGFATANNQGAQIATGDFLIFLNSDTIATDDFISPCIETLIKNNHLGAISPILLLPNKHPQKSAYGIFPNFWRLVRQKTKIDPILEYKESYAIVDWISGCAFIIKKSIFEKISGWDNNYFLYYEDIDICRNLKAHSLKVAICHNANIIHLGGQSLKSKEVKKNIFYESQDYYFKKWHGVMYLWAIRIARFFYKFIVK